MPVAYILFIVPALAAYVFAMAGARFDWRWALAAVVAPATGITIISGQSGFLSGALMIGGLRLVSKRPMLAGILFGLLAYKPQLGVLLPVVLISAGQWRAVASAVLTVLACILVSTYFLGLQAWL